jgi:hypothetical protein
MCADFLSVLQEKFVCLKFPCIYRKQDFSLFLLMVGFSRGIFKARQNVSPERMQQDKIHRRKEREGWSGVLDKILILGVNNHLTSLKMYYCLF